MASEKKPEGPDSSMEDAFALVDKMSSKLDDLKSAFNKGAKEIRTLKSGQLAIPGRTLPPPRPVDPPPVQVAHLPPESGRYSFKAPSVDRVDLEKLRLPIPRPRSKAEIAPVVAPKYHAVPKDEPQARPSGRFYLELQTDGTNASALRDKLGQIGRIVDSGEGTATARDRAWVELATSGDMSKIIRRLRELDVRENLAKLVNVLPGEGALQARQLDLFVPPKK